MSTLLISASIGWWRHNRATRSRRPAQRAATTAGRPSLRGLRCWGSPRAHFLVAPLAVRRPRTLPSGWRLLSSHQSGSQDDLVLAIGCGGLEAFAHGGGGAVEGVLVAVQLEE